MRRVEREPDHVIDQWGNTWRRYNDVGYVRLIVSQTSVPTFGALEQQFGPMTPLIAASRVPPGEPQ